MGQARVMNQHVTGETIERTLPEPLQELLEHCTDLTDSETARLKELLYDYQHVFSLTEGDLGTTQMVKHRIETGNVLPIRQQPRRTSPWKHDEIERQVADLLHQGRVTESSSPWQVEHCLSQKGTIVTRRELLAIVEFVKQHRHYLQGARFSIRTDHAPLRSVINAKDPEGQLAPWIEFLSAFHFEIQYRAGQRHQNADALSRRPLR